MTQIRPKKALLALMLAGLGAGYFCTFSGWDIYGGIKPMLMLVPVQLGVVFYFLWLKPQKD